MRTILGLQFLLCFCLQLIAQDDEKVGLYTKEQWRSKIDSTWGTGSSTTQKLSDFDNFWKRVDEEYPSFHNLNIDWDSFNNIYRPEIEAGVSRGRFYGIICKMFLSLKDIHTRMVDIDIATSELNHGTPVLVPSGYWEVGHFGAALAPMPDSSLFIYKVVENHPLNLELGDIILGYEGVPWKELYPKLLDIEFPVAGYYNQSYEESAVWGSTTESYEHIWLTAAGMNWHLFDTLDVLKYKTGMVEHYSVSSLENFSMQLTAAGQIQISGIQFPELLNNESSVSWGIIEGTQIGYIYSYSWDPDAWDAHPGNQFYNAVLEFINNPQIEGLIIDSRLNGGGNIVHKKGLGALLNQDWDLFVEDVRDNKTEHFEMTIAPWDQVLGFEADHNFFDKPIAVLTGPGSQSMGDIVPVMLKSHPYSRSFGLPTNGAFGLTYASIQGSWDYWYTGSNIRFIDKPGEYLTHMLGDVDEEMWLLQEDAVKEEDTVVKRAIEWIQNLAYARDTDVDKSYLQPSESVEISTLINNRNSHELAVTAFISVNESTIMDSVSLSSTDSVRSASWMTPPQEDVYFVSIRTTDIDEGTTRSIANAARFTTSGPVRVESFSSPKTSPFDPSRVTFDIYLENAGTTDSLKNIQATIYPDSLTICSSNPSGRSFGDLNPGEIKKAGFSVTLDSMCVDSSEFNIALAIEISSDGYVLWHDSLEVFVTGIAESQTTVPQKFALKQNYPNPFNPTTIINYELQITSDVQLTVFDITGREVKTLVNQKQAAGQYSVTFDASGLSSGIYFYRLSTSSGFVQTRKMVLLK